MDDNTIGPLQGIRQQDEVFRTKEQDILGINQAYQLRPVSESKGIEQVRKSDCIQFSDEVKELGPEKSAPNIDALKSTFADIRNKVGAVPSGSEASDKLVQDVGAVQAERAGMQGKPAGPKLGPTPGVYSTGTFSSRGGVQGIEAGARPGSTFSSRRTSPEAYEPGGGRATPNMVKLQTDYAQAIKQGDTVSPAAENKVLGTFAEAGKNEKPIKAMLGIQA